MSRKYKTDFMNFKDKFEPLKEGDFLEGLTVHEFIYATMRDEVKRRFDESVDTYERIACLEVLLNMFTDTENQEALKRVLREEKHKGRSKLGNLRLQLIKKWGRKGT